MKNKFTHIIDWEQVKSVEDVIKILKGLELRVDPKKCNPRLYKYIIPFKDDNPKKVKGGLN